MNKSTKFILKLISNLIVIIAVTLAILLVGLKFTGLQIYTVISGSMEPTYHVGSLIYVKKVDPSTLKIKDPITFELSDKTIATHRIVEIVTDETNPNVYKFRTKGDANKDVDANLVEPNKVLGKAIFTIPYLGYLATYIQSYPGNVVAICTAIAMLILVIILDMLVDDKHPQEKEETKNTKKPDKTTKK
jgi:signal peptidase